MVVARRASPKLKPINDLTKIEEAFLIIGLLSPKAMEALAEDLGLEEKNRVYLLGRYVQRLHVDDMADRLFVSERHLRRIRKCLLVSCKSRIIS